MSKHYNPNDKANKRKKVLMIALAMIVVMLAAFLLLRGCTDTPTEQEPSTTSVYLEDDGSSIDGEVQTKEREDIMKELEKQQLVVTDKLSSNITFPSGDIGTVGEWIVENPQENDVIQQAEVYFGDVLIAKSTPIYPNQHITGVSLLEEIESGEYDVTAYLNYYDLNTKEFVSKAGYKIHLTVR